MGLLTLSKGMGRSYGLFGSAEKTAYVAPAAADPAKPSPATPFVPAYSPGDYAYASS